MGEAESLANFDRLDTLYVCVAGLATNFTDSLLLPETATGVCEVGDRAIGDGDGVRARGLRGMLCTLLRRFGDLMAERLLLRPCREPGRLELNEFAGELGPLERGELLPDE